MKVSVLVSEIHSEYDSVVLGEFNDNKVQNISQSPTGQTNDLPTGIIKSSLSKSASARQLGSTSINEYRHHPHYNHHICNNNFVTQSSITDENEILCSRCDQTIDHITMNHLSVSPIQSPNDNFLPSTSSGIGNTGGGSGGVNGGSGLTSNPTSSALIKRNESSNSVTFPNEMLISRRPSVYWQEIMSTRRPSAVMATIKGKLKNPKLMGSVQEDVNGSVMSLNSIGSNNMSAKEFRQNGGSKNEYLALLAQRKNRKMGDDELSKSLSSLYCKLLVILGVALPVSEIISEKIHPHIYHGFYVYLYCGSILFVCSVYAASIKNRTLFKILKNYHEKANNIQIRRKVAHFGSFYLRVGAIAFGIGTMVYSGLEFGQYFEGHSGCHDVFVALTPSARMILSIIQMQFIFLNTTELDMDKHKVIARFGLMHMVATNLCEWLYVLVEETRHEILHYTQEHDNHNPNDNNHPKSIDIESNNIANIIDSSIENLNNNIENSISNISKIFNYNNITNDTIPPSLFLPASSSSVSEISQISSQNNAGNIYNGPVVNCHRTNNIMGSLVQDSAPFLFPCTIEYSLICAVILYEMWKKIKSIPDIEKTRRDSIKMSTGKNQRKANQFSVDCSKAHQGLFFGILITVMTIISMIMYFVLHDRVGYKDFAMFEVTICEMIIYSVTSAAVLTAMYLMRDLKFVNKIHDTNQMNLDNTLLVVAQTGVFVYGMFSIMGSYFSISDGIPYVLEGLWSEILGLIQTALQTIFILNASWRRCKGAQQQRSKPGRQTITFLLIANVSMWFINTLIKGRAAFRQSHLKFFGIWAWTIITHVSMPLAIFYRFHSTICLFEIWKTVYKAK
ncbi:proton channel OtopLc isoform X2 [Condylostylus longicornis]|uniref:proton channel OtopLc isoform X2 n=1 Tax=Condylostylus longicornis TaxID=2530218 RepID=UPI00244DD5E3|nr:proton channel OtopLc isoform X2 [Condylostylus longicornis]